MSIFPVNDIDICILKYLNPDDQRYLSQTNKYYNKLIKPLLEDYIKFFVSIKSIKATKLINDISSFIFRESIEFGKLHVCKYLNNRSNHLKKYTTTYLETSCRYSSFEIFLWIFEYNDIHSINSAFYIACMNNQVEIAKYLYCNTKCKLNMSDDEFKKLFQSCCEYNATNTADLLLSLNITNHKYSFALLANFDYNINALKWMMSIGWNIHDDFELGFRRCCGNGYFENAKFIYYHQPFYIHIANYSAFEEACRNGHTNIAKWIYSIDSSIGTNYLNYIQQNSPKYIAEWIQYIIAKRDHDDKYTCNQCKNCKCSTYACELNKCICKKN